MDESGKQDFESFNVVDVDLICSRVKTLLAGKSIPERRYDFSSGTGSDQQESFCLKEKEFLIIEGIHALNPELSHRIGDNRTQRVYVSAMTQLNIDGDHRVSTSDNRLLRRMVRDYKFRGYTPEQTLERWASVRMGEERNIFPYQEQADFMFNSALVYELPVLCGTIKPLLQQISPSMENYHMVEKLLTLTQMFKTLDEKYVPGISILREFIGGSEFNY
ncbi:MAG: hypothetical protein H8D46_03985 [FCB group bacterium]|nr:hypothetical protein [FCB group bacterium]